MEIPGKSSSVWWFYNDYFYISFVSLYVYYSIVVLRRAAELTDKLSIKKALVKYSRVYNIIFNSKEIISEISASSESID